MIRALVLTHGGIGAELVRVTEMILGPVPGLAAMSNHGTSGSGWPNRRKPTRGRI
jgi:mannose/fructose-specific phosphotransferase system component IIA